MIHDVNHSYTTFLHTNPHFAQRNPGRAICVKNTMYFSHYLFQYNAIVNINQLLSYKNTVPTNTA